jgi:hypothetical protein
MVTGAALLRAAPATKSLPGVGSLLSFFAPTAGEPERWLFFGSAAGVAGVIVGLLGRRLQTDPWRRVAALWVAFYPAVGLGLATVTYLLSNTIRGRATRLSDVALAPIALPMMGLTFALFALVLLPLIAFPLMAAAITVEAWTRPEKWGQSPLARPIMQVAMIALLVMATGVALSYLRVSWQETPGSIWLVP